MINIAFNIDKNYIEQCKVVMNSIISNTTSKVHFHIIGLDAFEYKNYKITCYGKPDISIINRETNFAHITTAACYRLFLADLLEIDKVIYIDCDTIVLSDIKELWDKKVKLIAGCIDPLSTLHSKRNNLTHKYINSGVLLINLKQMRKINYLERIKKTQDSKYNLSLLDQDVINIAFEKEIEYIDPKWNVYSSIYDETTQEMIEARNNPSIIHWCGYEKPFNSITVWNRNKWMKYANENTTGKAIVLTYPDLDGKQQDLIKNTNIFKIACNWHAPELKPNVRLTLDNENTIKRSLSVDDVPVISVNYDYPDKRVKRVSYLPDRNSSLPSCVDYLVTKGYTHILLIATNKVTNNKPSSKGFADDNRIAIQQLQDCAYIYKYTDDADFTVPTMEIEEFINMNVEERILGIAEGKSTEKLLKTLAFSEAYKYQIKTIGYDNASIENGTLLETILPAEVKERILQGEVVIEHAGMEIRRLTGVTDNNTPKEEETFKETDAMSYYDMKKFVKEHNIQTVSMTKKDLEEAIKEFKGE